MRTALVLLALSLTLAGCSGTAANDDDPIVDKDTFKEIDVEATKTTGVIRGIVVDQSITPIEGAKVTLALPGGAKETTTTASGAFGFDDLSPGAYFLRATKAGYDAIQQSADVAAGVDEPPVVRMMLTFVPGSVGSFEVLHFEGFLECSVVAVLYFFPCENPVTGEEIGNDDFIQYWNLTSPASFIHVSLVWEPTQDLGTELYFNLIDRFPDPYNIVAYAGGPSPQVANANAEALAPLNAAGQFGVEVATNGESAADGLTGVSVQQDFDVFVVVFHNAEPPAGYAFHSDGEPQLG